MYMYQLVTGTQQYTTSVKAFLAGQMSLAQINLFNHTPGPFEQSGT